MTVDDVIRPSAYPYASPDDSSLIVLGFFVLLQTSGSSDISTANVLPLDALNGALSRNQSELADALGKYLVLLQ